MGSSSHNNVTTIRDHEGPNYNLSKKVVIFGLCGFFLFVALIRYHYGIYFSLSQQNPNIEHLFITSPHHTILQRSPPSPPPPPPSSLPTLKGSPPPQETSPQKNVSPQTSCDYTDGEWVPNKLEPLYNDSTCIIIKSGRNCRANGRPDNDYLHWRWKPKQCNLPRFEPMTFLQLLRNKHIAFVGDSLARNQIESLICMLATVSKPHLYYTEGEEDQFRKWHISPYNINISIYWSPFLVKGIEKNNSVGFNTLLLDKLDDKWAGDLGHIDVLVLSVGHWFLHQAVYKNGSTILGCHSLPNCTEFPYPNVYGKALQTTFDGILKRRGQKGSFENTPINVFLVTFPPAHFEGEWDKFGACSKTQPYKGNDKLLEYSDEQMRKNGVREVEKAKSKAKQSGRNARFVALDITKLAFLRPDGHPGPYMYPSPFANGVSERVQNDCVHWCLPGAIDTWNEIFLDVIKKLNGSYKGKRYYMN